MDDYSKSYEVIWADMDPNRHLRHSAYNDYAAQTRVSLFADYGMSIEQIAQEEKLGPILFREETKFLKEVPLSESIIVHCAIMAMRKDGSRWSFRHEVYRGDVAKAAVIVVDGAWLNLDTRKLGTPTQKLLEIIEALPRTDNFRWLPDQ
ncbi:thioesterase family protein [Aliifodinibius sp. S!AR15-10]|uniref:acyl-CoA thioesterase n=1 Tax=Aliifodinibius sp. S!AR15-10 TaxID=2950437 RepID=UPI002859330B|nr:acyl-CoA thioesterase [Aliifodinibius sp. S!AR15-10]MDR8392448.1 thioesterase family protein [Aliifodinibius sp. S!AR15-10]